MDLAIAGDAPADVARQLRAQLLDGGAGQQARVARQVLERQRQPEVGHHADQAFQAVGHRVIDPVRRQLLSR